MSVIDHSVKVVSKEDMKISNDVLEELRTLRRVLVSEIEGIEDEIKEMKTRSIVLAVRVLTLRLYNSIRRMEPIEEISSTGQWRT